LSCRTGLDVLLLCPISGWLKISFFRKNNQDRHFSSSKPNPKFERKDLFLIFLTDDALLAGIKNTLLR
jgi:hypothetical protein